MLKTKVMEDLDALLADLQSTTSHISSYQEAQGPPPPPPLGDSAAPLDDDPDSRESTPPPLPPPPTADVLGDLNDEPLYEPQDMRHQSQGNARSTPPGHQGLPPTSPASFTAPPPPSHPPPPVSSLQSPVASSPLPPKPATKPKPAPKPVSMLTNNLSELDMLLQDLSSAQFMAEVDRRNAANIMSNNGASESGAPVVPAGGGGLPGDRSVDSLLIELENTLPPGRPGMSSHMSMESMSSHYEAVRPRQAQIPPHGGAPARPPTQASPGPRVPMMAGPMPMSAVIGAAAGRQTASTATRELDDLMASLSDFKVSGQQVPQVQQFGASPYAHPHKLQQPQVSGQPQLQHVGEPPYAQPHKLINKTAMQTAIQPPTSNASMIEGIWQGTSGRCRRHCADVPCQMPEVCRRILVDKTCSGAAVDGLPPAAAGAQAAHDDHLETMLGNLSTDMSRQGIMTIPKGHCAACAKPIVGQVITALGRIWHPEHFTCSHCKEELGTRNFFERDGVPYCERDYHNLFSPRCGHCNGPILDKCVTALDKTWHPEHFFCAQCGRLFADDGFHEKDGHAYCREDYFELFAPKCGGCRRPIMDNYISALNRQWHPECFICTDCHMPFGGGSFFDHEGMPYCETHYHAKRGSLCAGCMKPITGRCITAMYKKFHPEHFVCAFCLKQLNKGTFKEQNEKPYCHPCFIKLFG